MKTDLKNKKPVIVAHDADANLANALYGNHYGVDWEYEGPCRTPLTSMEFAFSSARYKKDNPYHYGTPEWQACEDYNAGYNDALRDTLRERKVTQCPCVSGDM